MDTVNSWGFKYCYITEMFCLLRLKSKLSFSFISVRYGIAFKALLTVQVNMFLFDEVIYK